MSTLPRPKIALMTYAIDNRPDKGSALYARELVKRLLEDKTYEWFLVHYEPSTDPIYTLGATEILMPYTRIPFAKRFFRQMLFFWNYRNRPFTVMHWFQPRVYPFFWMAPSRYTVVTVHGAGDITAPSSFIFSRWVFNMTLRFFNRRVSALIADSAFGRQEIIEAYHTSPRATHVISLGGSEAFSPAGGGTIDPVKEKYGITGPYILNVSRHVPHKNILRLIDAYDQIRLRNTARKEKLVIVGSASLSYQKNLVRKGQSPFADDILFVTFVAQEDLNALYTGAALLAFPSLNEGFGLPVVEAFASGTPVVTSNTTSLAEIAGDAALTVDPTNTDALASAIERVLMEPSTAGALVAKGLARARAFRWSETAAKTLDVYGSLISRLPHEVR